MANELVQRWSRPIFEEARRYDEPGRMQEALAARRRRATHDKKEAEKKKGLKPGHPDFRCELCMHPRGGGVDADVLH